LYFPTADRALFGSQAQGSGLYPTSFLWRLFSNFRIGSGFQQNYPLRLQPDAAMIISRPCLLFIVLSIPFSGGCQSLDTAAIKKLFPVKSFVIPATMIAYGFVSLKTDLLQDIDEQVQEEIWEDHPHRRVHIDNYLQFGPAVAVYALNAVGIQGTHDLIDRSVLFLMSNVFLNIAASGLKEITHQRRPDGSDYLSFPSGHTAEAFASAEFLRLEYKHVSAWYGIGGYLMAAVTGYLRMYNDKHYLGDLFGGAGIGIASTDLSYWLYPKIKRLLVHHAGRKAFLFPFYCNGAGGLALSLYLP
jgi:membrane-associated phospholipid phosphatase